MNNDRLVASKEEEIMEPVNQLSGISKSVGVRCQPQQVRIEMSINTIALLFGMPLLLAAIILGSVGLGAYCLNRSVVIPNLTVNPPHIEAKLNVPPPTINLQSPEIPVTVNVPPMVVKPEMPIPNIYVTIPEGKTGQVQIVEKIIEKKVEVPVDRIVEKRVEVPIYVETSEQAAMTIQDIYPLCEKYVDDYFTKTGKDPKAEQKKWLEGWHAKVAEIGDEQRVANNTMINKRGAFKIESAKVDEVVEICRLMLRYRDAKLSIPAAFKEAMTADNLWKLKSFLAKGPVILAVIK